MKNTVSSQKFLNGQFLIMKLMQEPTQVATNDSKNAQNITNDSYGEISFHYLCVASIAASIACPNLSTTSSISALLMI